VTNDDAQHAIMRRDVIRIGRLLEIVRDFDTVIFHRQELTWN
jgi:hypothetical protein